jgi:2-oxoglutarate ferredoxin oxidoreductase subunit delta
MNPAGKTMRSSDVAEKRSGMTIQAVEHRINRGWCKGCGICVAFCPRQVLELDDDGKAMAVRPQDCIACRMCEMRCPDMAIEIIVEPEAAAANG